MDYCILVTSEFLNKIKVPFTSKDSQEKTLVPPKYPSLLSVPDVNYSCEVGNIEAQIDDGRLGIPILPYITGMILGFIYSSALLLTGYSEKMTIVSKEPIETVLEKSITKDMNINSSRINKRQKMRRRR